MVARFARQKQELWQYLWHNAKCYNNYANLSQFQL